MSSTPTQADSAVEKEELRQTLAGVLDVNVAELTDDAHFMDDLGVDSLMALEVVVVLEKKYDIRFVEEELRQITSLAKAHEFLTQKNNNR